MQQVIAATTQPMGQPPTATDKIAPVVGQLLGVLLIALVLFVVIKYAVLSALRRHTAEEKKRSI